MVRFASGFALGFLALPIAGATVLVLFLLASDRSSHPLEAPASFWTQGHQVSQAGGASVRVERRGPEVTQQTCREACDDLVYWYERAERVEVRNAGGDCLLCEEQGFRLPFARLKRWGLTGQPLRLEEARDR